MSHNHTLNLVEAEIGGGRISKKTIDQIESSDSGFLKISGLTQETFEYFVGNYGGRFTSIEFWKCPLISDLSPLETLGDIEAISYYWNQRAEKLWDMSKNTRLTRFAFEDFTRVKSLEQVSACTSLKELTFGNKVWVTQEIDSLEPLKQLKNLCKLGFYIKKVLDGRLAPISELPQLSSVDFPLNLFSTEKLAWLTSRIGDKTQSRCLAPYHRIEKPIDDGSKKKDTFIVGKRKPLLDWNQDRERISKYTQKFEALVAKYKANLSIPEPEK
ncbi:hypothetical protein QEH59_18280 [Coraliomargarita sp. SDUM461004]|uniref:Leucine-rich repeat domain-containing protein n=1 Tax=Thalassobacterium sedimentorum TaxID=3041258 RepID=A0ABU1ANX9_9BACT|nr:hypothetical protein [Coraliomargarita sp. SDUM461004]MDQ8196384.1 hypothetical protein [Coraliomargarita sp. SDUM461004]